MPRSFYVVCEKNGRRSVHGPMDAEAAARLARDYRAKGYQVRIADFHGSHPPTVRG